MCEIISMLQCLSSIVMNYTVNVIVRISSQRWLSRHRMNASQLHWDILSVNRCC